MAKVPIKTITPAQLQALKQITKAVELPKPQASAQHPYCNIHSAKMLLKYFAFAHAKNKLTTEMIINPSINGDKAATFVKRLREAKLFINNNPDVFRSAWPSSLAELGFDIPTNPTPDEFFQYAKRLRVAQRRKSGTDMVVLSQGAGEADNELESYISFGSASTEAASGFRTDLEEWLAAPKTEENAGYLYTAPGNQPKVLTENELTWAKNLITSLPKYTVITLTPSEVNIVYHG